jgi:hypothetical protein
VGFWLIVISGGAAMGGYVAYLWAHGHAALLQGPPHGLHGHGFLTYVAIVLALAAMSPWVLLEARRLAVKGWVVLLDGLAAAVCLRVLSDQQQRFVEWAGLVALYISAFLFPVLEFYVIGPLFEGRGNASSLEVER